MASGTILVIRATGTQGRAVTNHLLQHGYAVHALVRNRTEDRAVALQSIGATLFEGELSDANTISHAVAGCTGLFLNMMPSFNDDAEVQQAKSILEAARTAGVLHVIYSSSFAVGRPDEGQHWDPANMAAPALQGKQTTEELVRQARFQTWTILRPGYFMTNFLAPFGAFMFPELGTKAELVSSYHPDTVLPLIDPDDIGAFTVSSLLDPKKFGGQEIRICGDPRSVESIAQLLAKASGKNIRAIYRSPEDAQDLVKTNPLVAGQLMSLDMGRFVDMEEVLKWGIPLGTFEPFLEKEHDLVQKTFETVN